STVLLPAPGGPARTTARRCRSTCGFTSRASSSRRRWRRSRAGVGSPSTHHAGLLIVAVGASGASGCPLLDSSRTDCTWVSTASGGTRLSLPDHGGPGRLLRRRPHQRSEEHTSELQSRFD